MSNSKHGNNSVVSMITPSLQLSKGLISEPAVFLSRMLHEAAVQLDELR